MFKNYFKTAWRNIIRSKGYSALNIFGLAMGMAVALLVGLWVKYQYSYDRFIPEYNQLYQVARNFNSNGEQLTFTSTSLKLADKLRTDFPQIEYVAETDWFGPHDLIAGEKKFYISGGQVGKNFLQIFSLPMKEGNTASVLSDPYSIVLTESTAKSLFGDENPIGKTVRFDNTDNLKVTGVLKDLPQNSTFQFKYLVPFSYQEGKYDYIKTARQGNFSFNSFQIFAKLKKGMPNAEISGKIKNIEKTETANVNAMNSEVILQPLKDWHLQAHNENDKDTVGIIEYVHMFSIIGALVLIIACVNFINLTTARSEKRAREVGVRKAIGSRRKDLITQFLMESLLLALVSFCFSVLFVSLSLPSFNSLTGCNIQIPFFSPLFWVICLGSVFITGLAAGSKPAFYLSSFNPVKVLKGTIQTGKAASFSRQILVVLQFTCSVALIISTIVIYQQIQYAKNRPSGYNTNRLMTTDMNGDYTKIFSLLKMIFSKKVLQKV